MAQLCALRLLARAVEAGWTPQEEGEDDQGGGGGKKNGTGNAPRLPVTAITFACPALADAGLAAAAALSLGAGVAIRNYSVPEDVIPTILSSPEATMLFVSEGDEGEEGEGEEAGRGRGRGGEREEAMGRGSSSSSSPSSSPASSSSSRPRFPPPGPALGQELRARAAEVAREWAGGEEGETEVGDW